MANLWLTGTNNAINTTLNGSVAIGDTSITLTSASGLQAPGIIVIDRQDANGTNTPTLKEYVSFTGISTNTLTGCTRGKGNSTAQSHSSGAKVEEVFSITHWNDLITSVENVLTSGGALDTTKVMDLSSSQVATNKTFTNPILTKPTVNGSVSAYTTDTDGTTVTFDMSTSNIHTVTLGGARTLAVTNTTSGQSFTIVLKQDSSGSRTVTWWGNIKWVNATVPTLTTTASRWDIFVFLYDGTNYYGSVVGQNYG